MENSSYQVWFTISVKYSYYSTDRRGIKVEPDGSAIKKLMREKMLFHQADPYTWQVIKKNKAPIFRKGDQLVFNLKDSESEYERYNKLTVRSSVNTQVRTVEEGGIWKQLLVSCNGLKNCPFDIVLDITP